MNDKKPAYLEAKVSEYRPIGAKHVRITAEGCVIDFDMKMLANAQLIERDVYVAWGDTVKRKKFTRLKVGRKSYLACRTTGTLYSVDTGLTTSPGLRLA